MLRARSLKGSGVPSWASGLCYSTIMKFLIGRKMEMSHLFGENGSVIPVTWVLAGPCTVTGVRTTEQDGYQAVMVGFEKSKHPAKPQATEATKKNIDAAEIIREVRLEDGAAVQVGEIWTVSEFEKGDKVDVAGLSKGHGFSGVVKRHHFHGHPATHGTKDQIRTSGSIGSQGPQRVLRGMRMAGRMGGGRVTVKNLEVVSVDPARNALAIRGAVPGARNTVLVIRGRGNKTFWQT